MLLRPVALLVQLVGPDITEAVVLRDDTRMPVGFTLVRTQEAPPTVHAPRGVSGVHGGSSGPELKSLRAAAVAGQREENIREQGGRIYDLVTKAAGVTSLGPDDKKGDTLHRLFAVSEDRDGNQWFGTVYSGVWRYDGEFLTNNTR